MQLRSGKRYYSTSSSFETIANISYEIIEEKDDEKYVSNDIVNLLQKLVNYANELNSNLNEKIYFNEMVRIYREIYYLIDFYNMQKKERFQYFISKSKERAEDIIPKIDRVLNRNWIIKGFKLTGKDKESAEYLREELVSFLNNI